MEYQFTLSGKQLCLGQNKYIKPFYATAFGKLPKTGTQLN